MPSSAAPRTATLRLDRQVAYSVGEIANASRGVLYALFVFFFYTTVLGLPGTIAGIAAGLGVILDAVIDPYIGYASDRLQSRFGRRHALMLLGASTVGATVWAIFSPPRGLDVLPLAVWFFVTGALSRIAGGLFQVPYYALGAELVSDYHERTVLAGVRGLSSLVGSLSTATLGLVVFFPTVVAGVDPKLDADRYPLMGLFMGVLISATSLFTTLVTLRWPVHAVSSSAPTPRASAGLVGFGREMFVALANPSFRLLFASFSLVYLGTVVNSVVSTHFYTYFAVVLDSGQLGLVRGTFYVAALVGVPGWLRLAPRFEKQQLYLFATGMTALAMLTAFALLGPGRLFGLGAVVPLMLGQALAGLAAGLFWIMPASMLADVTDDDALASGRDRQGVFFGMLSFGQKLVTGLAALVAGLLIDDFAHLVPGQAAQSAETVERVGVLFGVLPAALLLVGAVAIVPYRLNRRRVAELQVALARHAYAPGPPAAPPRAAALASQPIGEQSAGH